MDIKKHLDEWGWDYKEAPDDELQIAVCPFCGDDRGKFYINEKTGYYYCHLAHCEVGGSWYTLLRHIGKTVPIRKVYDASINDADKAERFGQEHARLRAAAEKILEDEEALKWLNDKGISTHTIQKFQVGVRSDTRGEKWLSFPYLRDERLVNAKYRTITGQRKFRRLPGGISTLYNDSYVSDMSKRKRILITEGETDCLAAYSAGIHWVAGVTIGSKGINSEWIDQLDRFERVYLCFDNDIAGRAGAQKLAKRLGEERVHSVPLPVGTGDLSEFFSNGGTREEFNELLRNSRPFEVEHIITVTDAIRQVAEEFKLRGSLDTGIKLPWLNVDKCMGGLLSGDLVVLSGVPGVGKTTFALNVAYHLSQRLGIPSLFFCMEMRPERLARKLMALHLEKDIKFLKEIDVLRCYNDFTDTPFYFGHAYRDVTMDKVANTLREAVRRYGIGFMVFDHLHFLCRNFSNMVNEVGVTIREFKLLAEDEGIPIFVVVHPRKIDQNTKGQFKIPTMMDLRDSGMIPADADFVIVFHRKRIRTDEETEQAQFDDNVLVRVEKARYESGGDSYLKYHGEKSLYVE